MKRRVLFLLKLVVMLPIFPIMGLMTKEEKTEVAEVVATALKESGALDANRKFTPGDEEKGKEGDPPVEIIANPEDKILADPRGGFRDIAEFYAAVAGKGAKWYGTSHTDKLKAYADAVTKTTGYMEEGDMAQGGYLVPEEFRAQLLMTQLENSIVQPRATRIPMQSNRIGIPAVNDADHSTNYFGGVIVYRTGEGAQKTPTNPTLGRVYLTLHKLTGLVYVSDELLEDSPISIPPILNTMFGMAIAFEEDDDYLAGNGSNRPLGAFHTLNPSIVAVAKETGQAATTIVAENIIKMWSRVHPASMRNAVWVANNDCFPQLATMSIAVGTGGVPVYLPANGVSGTPFGTLMGRPLLLSEKMQTLGTQGDIGIADFSQYLIADKAGGGLKAATSIHIRFDYDEAAFRWVLRYDGQPWWLSAITPKRGANTLSPFVVLAVRS